MHHRTPYLVIAAAMLILPTMGLGTVLAKPHGHDLAVTSLVAGRALLPPTRWTLSTTVCNLGDRNATEGAVVTWTAKPIDGLLTVGDGETRVVGSQIINTNNITKGECRVINTFWNTPPESGWGGLESGEWEFTAGVTLAGDINLANNQATTSSAFPAAAAGTGLGGFDLPTLP